MWNTNTPISKSASTCTSVQRFSRLLVLVFTRPYDLKILVFGYLFLLKIISYDFWEGCHFFNILTFTFVVWIVNRFEQIPLQNSRKALKANEHSLGDINRVNIATSDGFLLFTRLLKALPYNSMTSNENAHTHRTKVQQSDSIENAYICGGRPQSWASGEISKLKNPRIQKSKCIRHKDRQWSTT